MAVPILLYFPPFPDGKKGEQSAWAGETAGKAVFFLPRSGKSHPTYTYNTLWAYTTHTHTHTHTSIHICTTQLPGPACATMQVSLSFPLHQFPMISARKVKEICQASLSVSARVAISGLASGELRSVGDGHQPAQPSFRGCEGVTPPAPFSQAHSSSYSIFSTHRNVRRIAFHNNSIVWIVAVVVGLIPSSSCLIMLRLSAPLVQMRIVCCLQG